MDDADLGGAQDPVLDHVAGLLAVDDGAGLLARYGRLVEGFVAVGVELVAGGVEGLDLVLEERLEEQAVGDLDAGVELLEVRSGRLCIWGCR